MAKWAELLSPSFMATVLKSDCMTVLEGDITKENMGLSDSDIQTLHNTVNMVIHAASSINLRDPLKKLAQSVIAPSLALADLALGSPKLERFVFVSTAYANAHLWMEHHALDVPVDEKIYPLAHEDGSYISAIEAWDELQKTGTTGEFRSHNFPWPYGYAKQLTERLLVERAAQQNKLQKLLILRPSVIGPADELPFPGFTTPWSTPSTACAAAYVLHPGCRILMATRFKNPNRDSTIDEVPVDVVVDRLLVHLALGTSGCVHAVSGKDHRIPLQEWWDAFRKERRIPWKPKPVWLTDDWHSSRLHPMARIFKIIGASFAFAEGKTVDVLEKLDDKEHLRLFAAQTGEYSLVDRRHHIRHIGFQMAKRKKNWPLWMVKLATRKLPRDHRRETIGMEK